LTPGALRDGQIVTSSNIELSSKLISARLRHDVVTYATFEAAGYSTASGLGIAIGTINKTETCMRILAAIGALAIVVGICAAVFFLGGFYSVAGTKEDPAIVTWALTNVRTASINRHATDTPPASLNDPATVSAGAKAYADLGCANCHGAPGVPWLKLSEGLHPDPPDLKEVAGELTPSQLFWVIKHGINMTGMPSFEQAGAKDDQIWSVVAFVKKLPSVSEADYKSWTGSSEPAPAKQ
jgi:mono/diheme cytochrome c family protein